MKVKASALVLCFGLLAAGVPLLAHHSFAAEYDANKPITITGMVTKLEWMNPHARFYVDVKGTDGKVTNWNFELGAIPVLLKQGWRKDSLKAAIKSRSRALGEGRFENRQRPQREVARWPRVFAGSSGGDAPAESIATHRRLTCGIIIITFSSSRPPFWVWPYPLFCTRLRAPRRLKAGQRNGTRRPRGPAGPLPRLPDGHPDLTGIWNGFGGSGGDAPTCCPGPRRSSPASEPIRARKISKRAVCREVRRERLPITRRSLRHPSSC